MKIEDADITATNDSESELGIGINMDQKTISASWSVIKKGFWRVFFRDYTLSYVELLELMIQALIFTSVLTFMITGINRGFPNGFQFNNSDQIFFYIWCALCILFGGAIVDLLIKKPFVFTSITVFSTLMMAICLYTPAGIHIYGAQIILAMCASLLGILFFTRSLTKTSLLNRARTISFIVFCTITIATPMILVINQTDTFYFTWIITGTLVVIHLFLVRKIPDEIIQGHAKLKETLSFGNYFKLVRETGIDVYFWFLIIISAALGFFVSNIFGQISSFYETLIAVIVGILSFPLIGITLDHIGRKPVIIMTIVAVGALSLFFDYPEINVDSITMKAIRIGLFIFAGLLIIILTAVLVGDVSTRFSRGRVMSVILFAVVAGAIIGSLVENNITYNRDALTFEERVRTADWIGLLFLISLAFVTRAKETLQPHSQDWRDFIERIYINTKAGLNVFAYNFKYPSLNRTNTEEEDLVSGGLSGVQSILREISHSNRTIEVLDHGDKKLLFHEGKYTTAVLFTKMDLNVLREKLAQFVNLFEYYNQSELEHFFGNVSKLKQLDTLLKRFFT